ncbi:MAG TPA: type II toxin-antitoxin system RatA family toxin [Burkholderiales bacterium]|nr:type II toxin-antitoxin system RatA family toxin [Burkholderiales bacterium]
MTRVERIVLVPYTAQQMFALVDGIENYPQFLPWCSGTLVTRRDDKVTAATLHINYRRLKLSFATENTKEMPRLIEMKLVKGPFRHLEGGWRFIELGGEGCKIEFQLQYEFSSKLVEKLLSGAFQHIADSFVDGFIKRAEKIYAK